jgi:hypothetical protein
MTIKQSLDSMFDALVVGAATAHGALAQGKNKSPNIIERSGGSATVGAQWKHAAIQRTRDEAKKQGISKPLIGKTTLLGQKVIDLAGDAANGIKDNIALYESEAAAQKAGKREPEAIPAALHGFAITPDDDLGFRVEAPSDDTGAIDRNSVLAQVKDGRQIISKVQPKLE